MTIFTVRVPYRYIPKAGDVFFPNEPPAYTTAGACAFDLMYVGIPYRLEAGERALLRTGLHVAVPEGYVLLVVPRSGLPHRQGVTVLNTPGTIDTDYRGCIMVNLINTSDSPHIVRPGDRIAQGLLLACYRAEFQLVDELDETARGEAGHGSTGA